MLGLALNGSDVSGSTLKTTFRGRGRIYLQLESAGSHVIFNPLKSLHRKLGVRGHVEQVSGHLLWDHELKQNVFSWTTDRKLILPLNF